MEKEFRARLQMTPLLIRGPSFIRNCGLWMSRNSIELRCCSKTTEKRLPRKWGLGYARAAGNNWKVSSYPAGNAERPAMTSADRCVTSPVQYETYCPYAVANRLLTS